MGFSPKSIFSSKDAANWRKMLDSFFVGKISYYMVTPATSFCDADSKTKKLSGVNGVASCRGSAPGKTFIFVQGTCMPLETSAGTPHFVHCARNCKSAPHGSAGSRRCATRTPEWANRRLVGAGGRRWYSLPTPGILPFKDDCGRSKDVGSLIIWA